MVLQKDTDFAIQLLVFYFKKCEAGDDFAYRREVLRATGINTEAQTRICRLLADKGLLEAMPCGRAVGYRLAVPPEEINLKMIIEIVENTTELVMARNQNQNVYNSTVWKKLQSKFNRILESVTLNQLAKK